MRRSIVTAAAMVLFIGASAGAALAKEQCRDAKGKFIKCPPAASAPAKPAQCKDAKGKFAKCGTPGATPVAAKAAPKK